MRLLSVRVLRSLGTAMALVIACLLAAPHARAAEPEPFTHAQLDQMLAPIALFPDALLAQVLMASTYPLDVQEAVDWAFANRNLEGDAAVTAVQDKPWDPSVQSLVAFPQVLAMLGEKPEWVRDLGDAFLAQPGEVMDSVQFLRQKAKDAGNLESNTQQVVGIEPAPPSPQVVVVNAPPPPTQIITIVPANPRVVFVPIYNPFWAFGPWWHPGFPPFFFPPGPRWGWGWSSAASAGFWWGVGIGVSNSLWGGVDWRRRNVNINVNQWNSINVNRRIDSRDRNVAWQHEVRNRRGVPYRDAATRERLQQRAGEIRSRDEFRGRDVQRDRAREELANRVGAANLDRSALRDIDRSQLPQRPGDAGARDRLAGIDRSQIQQRRGAEADRAQLRERAANIDRSGLQDRGGNIDRSRLQDRAGTIDRSQLQDRAGNIDRSQLQNRAAGIDRSQLPQRQGGDRSQLQNRTANLDRAQLQNRRENAAFVNRDNALRNAGNATQTRRQIDRGGASHQAMQQRRQQAGAAAARRRGA